MTIIIFHNEDCHKIVKKQIIFLTSQLVSFTFKYNLYD
jgi:hypothetical protein